MVRARVRSELIPSRFPADLTFDVNVMRDAALRIREHVSPGDLESWLKPFCDKVFAAREPHGQFKSADELLAFEQRRLATIVPDTEAPIQGLLAQREANLQGKEPRADQHRDLALVVGASFERSHLFSLINKLSLARHSRETVPTYPRAPETQA